VQWREANPLEVPVFAGVMVLASEAQARRTAAAIPDISIPESLIRRVSSDRQAGVEATCEYILQIRDSGMFDGVHLIPVARYRGVPARLE
jgi:methylenetetrahydrofolate reductase (NADPH)